jgi:peptidoglycan/LPS O-acetylase OafA/YrhL
MGTAAESPSLAEAPAEPAPVHARFLETRNFSSLDGLRAISILAVVWHHTMEVLPEWRIAQRGFLGVDLFFVISGFLIVTLLLRERRRTGTTSLGNFYVRRFLRIFPPYYAMLAVVGAAAALRRGHEAAAILHDLPWALFYLSNLVPMASLLSITWSLAVEEQFYLIVPAVLKRSGRAFPWVIAGAYLVVILPPFGAFPGIDLPGFFRETTFGPILLGVGLALLLDDPRGHAWAHRALGHPAAPAVAAALVAATCCHPAADISGWPRLLIHWSLLLLVATCVLNERHVATPLLAAWPMRRIGAVSYGIYLFHLLVRHGVDVALRAAGHRSHLVFFAATALGTWLVAEVSYRGFESRFLALKARWS